MTPINAFTIDLEDWFQGLTSTNPRIDQWPSYESRVVEATDKLLALLRAYKVEATFFTLGYVADHHPELIERICADGHEVGVHGYHHRFISRITPDEYARELELGIEALERVTGERPVGHRAPYFSVNASTPWAFEIMQDQGIEYDSSVFPTRNMLYGFPGAPRFPYRMQVSDKRAALLELPASTVKIGGKILPMSGGFYMRTFPYRFTRWSIRQLHDAGHPAVLYVHPWELDTGQKYNQVTRRERITHYHGRRGLEKKLHRLFSDFRFTSMRKLIEQIKWGESPVETVVQQPPSKNKMLQTKHNPIERTQTIRSAS